MVGYNVVQKLSSINICFYLRYMAIYICSCKPTDVEVGTGVKLAGVEDWNEIPIVVLRWHRGGRNHGRKRKMS